MPDRFIVNLTEGQLSQISLTDKQWSTLHTCVSLGKLIIDRAIEISEPLGDLRDMKLIEISTARSPDSPIHTICIPTKAGVARVGNRI